MSKTEGQSRNENVAFEDLPSEVLESVASYLPAVPDLFSFISTNRYTYSMNGQESFWKNLLMHREGIRGCVVTGTGSSTKNKGPASSSPFAVSAAVTAQEDANQTDRTTARFYKDQFLRAEFCRSMKSGVLWHSIDDRDRSLSSPTAREGHNSCLLGVNHDLLVVTVGFTEDHSVFLKDMGRSDNRQFDQLRHHPWHRIAATVQPAATAEDDQHSAALTRAVQPSLFAYGASLTRLSATTAVRFGGFQAGSAPFQLEGGEVIYHGDGGQRQIEVERGQFVALSDSGASIFVDVPAPGARLQAIEDDSVVVTVAEALQSQLPPHVKPSRQAIPRNFVPTESHRTFGTGRR